MNDFPIIRHESPGQYALRDIFPRIDDCRILYDVFGTPEEAADILSRTKVHIIDHPHEMFVSNEDGSIAIGLSYLCRAPEEHLYLDIIHELCHVRQYMDGRNLYDRSKSYVDRETEVEAYEVTVREARRIGLNDSAIADYLRVSWITPEEHKRLAARLGVRDDRKT